MALHPTQTRKERLLGYGMPASGKSKAWRDIADTISKTESTAKIYVVDTDHAWDAQRPPLSDTHLDKIVIQTDVYNWATYRSSLTGYRAEATEDDWLVVDMINSMWSQTQGGFVEEVYGREIDTFFMEARKAGENVGGDYGVNWVIINKMYGVLNDRIKTWPGHVLALTPATELRFPDPKTGRGGDPEAMLNLYSRVGMKPEGQKNLTFEFHTVLFFQQRGADWTITTIKERSSPEQPREYLVNEKVEPDFVSTYLYKVAKWRP